MTKFVSFSEERRVKSFLLDKSDNELHNLVVSSTNGAIKDLAKRIIEARELLNLSNPNKEDHAAV